LGKYWSTSVEYDKFLLGMKSRESGGWKCPSGVQGQNPSRGPGDEVTGSRN